MGRRASDKTQFRVTVLLAILCCTLSLLVASMSIQAKSVSYRAMEMSLKAGQALDALHDAIFMSRRPSPFRQAPHEDPSEGPQ